MGNSYTKKYEVLKTFKKDHYQKVLIGADKKDPDEVVVINILHRDRVSKTISKSQFPKGLNNLIHLEETDDELVVVTEYKEGTPLESYLEFFDTTVKHKINLAYEFLTMVVKYDNFNNSIKKILIDESQITVKDDKLYFNELLFLDEDFSEPTEFSVISSKLGKIIEKIVFSKEPEEDKDNDRASRSILKLISKLNSNDHNYQNIHAVYNAFRKIYIYEIFMEDESVQEEEDNEDSTPIVIIPPKETITSEALEDSEMMELKNEVTELKNQKDKATDSLPDDSEVLKDEALEADAPLEEEPTEELDDTRDISEEELNDIGNVSQEELVDIKDDSNEKLEDVEDVSQEQSSDSKDIYEDNDELIANLNEMFAENKDVLDEADNHEKPKAKSRGYIGKIAIGVLLLALISFGAVKLLNPVLDSFKPSSPIQSPGVEAYFVYEKIADSYRIKNESKILGKDNALVEILWEVSKGDTIIERVNQKVEESKKVLDITFESEGQYTIVLNVKDKYGNTDEHKEVILYNNKVEIDELKNNTDTEEKLDNLSLNYSSSSIVKDSKAFRSGNYSIRLGEEGKNNSEKIFIDNIDIKNKPMVSMWIASNSKDKVSIIVRGYRNNVVQFSKQIAFTPKEAKAWEMVEISETTKNIDKIELVFKDFISPIWLDDIEVSSYK